MGLRDRVDRTGFLSSWSLQLATVIELLILQRVLLGYSCVREYVFVFLFGLLWSRI